MTQPPKTALFVAVVGVLVAAVTLAPLQLHHHQHQHRRNSYHQFDLVLPVDQSANPFKFSDAEDGTARSERSTNLSHITGTAKKIQIYVNNKFLQIMPDKSVNGAVDDGSDYTIFQRSSVNNGQLYIQSVATCLFLCMDSCGFLYGSREFTEDCVFNENFLDNHYIHYSSARYSNEKVTFYLAIDNKGKSRKVRLRKTGKLGNQTTYVKVLPMYVSSERVADLAYRILRAQEIAAGRSPPANPIRHSGVNHVCPLVQGHELAENADEVRNKHRCRKRGKRKNKNKKSCEGVKDEDDCEVDSDDEGVNRNECEDGDKECRHKKVATTQRVRTNKNNRCEVGATGCKKKERGDNKKNRNHRKCENGEVECKRREVKRESRNDQRKHPQPVNRRRCKIVESDEECRKRLQDSRRRRPRMGVQGQDENVTKKKLNSGKNKKKSGGDGEISKDFDSGRKLAEQLEIATNLNTPADVITEASALQAREFNNQESRNLSTSPIQAEDSVKNAEDIPSDNQRGNRDETPEDSGETVDLEPASTPYTSYSTPAPLGHFTKDDSDVTSSDMNPHTDVTAAETTAMDDFYDDAVDKK